MRHAPLAGLSCVCPCATTALCSCSTEPEGTADGSPHGAADGGVDAGDIVFVPPDAGVPPDASDYEGPSIVYGHSSGTLYELDPTTKAVTVVGAFSGCSDVIDQALDKDSTLYATAFDGLYRIDAANAQCTLVSSGTYPNSLSFVPAGTLDPNVEALVGYNGSDYVRIDTTTGVVTIVGALTGGHSSSGDIVSVKGGATFLTVKGPGCDDCPIKVNPKTGDLLENLGSIGYTDVFGLAYWAGKVYGFTDGGKMFEVSPKAGLPTTIIPVPNPPVGPSFWGAGSTTSAPAGPN
ncbi:MAG TPA: hypothetical protein VGK67_19715 [Myxococcales bacterium]|jgi:hypothetical protein